MFLMFFYSKKIRNLIKFGPSITRVLNFVSSFGSHPNLVVVEIVLVFGVCICIGISIRIIIFLHK